MVDEPFGYQKLQIWTRSMALVEEVYRLTESLPLEERFGLQGQMRRASVSIPANIAEGFGRGSSKAFAQFIKVAMGSSYELSTLLELTHRLELLDTARLTKARAELVEIARMLSSFQRRLMEGSNSVNELTAEYEDEVLSSPLPATNY